jgi:hypothetical protein
MITLFGVWPVEVRQSCSSDALFDSLMRVCLVLVFGVYSVMRGN